MLKYISDRLAERRVRRILDDARVRAVMKLLDGYLEEYDRARFSAQSREAAREDAVQRIVRVMTAANPVATCREELLAAAIQFSEFSVLIIGPPPEHDETGLRGLPGITGELKQHLLTIGLGHERIGNVIQASGGEPTWNMAWDAALFGNVMHWVQFSVMNALRIQFGDVVRAPHGDWGRFLVYCLHVHAEDRHRKQIGLPPALAGFMQALMYSTMFNCVEQGHQDPMAVWMNDYREEIESGRLFVPDLRNL